MKLVDVKGKNTYSQIRQALIDNPARFVGLSAFHPDFNVMRWMGEMVKSHQPNTTLLVGNAHATIDPQDFIYMESPFDIAVLGEGEITCLELAKMDKEIYSAIKGIAFYKPEKFNDFGRGCIKTGVRDFMGLAELPTPAYDHIDMEFYLRPTKLIIRRLYARVMPILTGRGCPFNCLRGNSLIDTVEMGKMPISELVGKTPLVLTRDPHTKKPIYVRPAAIFKTRKDAELIRVHFTDGSHIDCTPDHRFMALQYKNQFQPRKEWEVEAQYLKTGQNVVACRYPGQLKGARTMMERLLGRSLNKGEIVHHKNKDKDDQYYNNIEVISSHKEHLNKRHPEFSERMKGKNNPVHLFTKEQLSDIGRKNNKGKRRTSEQKERYSQSKLGSKNPNFGKATWNKGLTKETDERVAKYGRKHLITNALKRVDINNHKVSHIEKLSIREDVYCMNLPGYDWFFANDILVHNCLFCAANVVWKANRGVCSRVRPVGNVIDEIDLLRDRHKADFVYLSDDMFGVNKKWIGRWFDRYGSYFEHYHFPYGCQTRANIITEDMVIKLKESGCIQLDIGVESGDQKVLDLVNKKITLEQVRQSFEWCRKHKLRSFATMMINMPHETKKSIQLSERLLKEIRPSAGVTFAVCTPYPGARIYESYVNPKLTCDEYGLLDGNNLRPDERFRMTEHTMNLNKLRKRLSRKFKAIPIVEKMFPFEKRYWWTVFRSVRLRSYVWAWTKDILKTFLTYWRHRF